MVEATSSDVATASHGRPSQTHGGTLHTRLLVSGDHVESQCHAMTPAGNSSPSSIIDADVPQSSTCCLRLATCSDASDEERLISSERPTRDRSDTARLDEAWATPGEERTCSSVTAQLEAQLPRRPAPFEERLPCPRILAQLEAQLAALEGHQRRPATYLVSQVSQVAQVAQEARTAQAAPRRTVCHESEARVEVVRPSEDAW